MVTKEDETITNYSSLAKEIRKICLVLMKIVRLVVGCLGVVYGWLEGFFERSWDSRRFGRKLMQASAVLGTIIILHNLHA